MWIRVAASLGFLAVALGAFGAHLLRSRVTDAQLGVWQTGVLYHALHAVALLAVSLYGDATGRAIKWPALAFTVGVVLFSGSLYAMVLTGVRKLGIITPFGGLAFLTGWVLVAVQLGRGR
ncbi:MAG: DUF423 domain-containing protein [Polyangiaceae bacterium]|nr:DUF423 domain-containing protein [Polyangiaceae bacterium]